MVWVLKKDQGDVLDMPADDGTTKPVRIDGLLDNSVFQSGLLLSEGPFPDLYPTQEGYNFFLIETPPGKEEEVRSLLNTALADRGFEAVPTAERLQSYLAVENTYLSTFQALGGLGLILGSLGLAVVLLRSVWERRGELALLRALGFRRLTLAWLVLAENGFLLLLGMAAGRFRRWSRRRRTWCGRRRGRRGWAWRACWPPRSRSGWRSARSPRSGPCGRRWSRPCGMNKSIGRAV